MPALFLVCGKVHMAYGLTKDTLWPAGEAEGEARDLQPILPSLHRPPCTLNGLSNPFFISSSSCCYPLECFLSKLLVTPSGMGFPPLLSFFKVPVSFPDLPRSGYGSPQSLLCWQPFAMFYLFLLLQNKMLLILVSSGDGYVSNTSLARSEV